MRRFSEYTQWSPIFDCEVTRLSVFDGNGSEYFFMIPRENARRYRDRRDEALEAIDVAITEGLPPGEVRLC